MENACTISKEQEAIIDFTINEISNNPLEDRAKMYAAICLMACMKWPEHSQKFVDAYKKTWLTDVVEITVSNERTD